MQDGAAAHGFYDAFGAHANAAFFPHAHELRTVETKRARTDFHDVAKDEHVAAKKTAIGPRARAAVQITELPALPSAFDGRVGAGDLGAGDPDSSLPPAPDDEAVRQRNEIRGGTGDRCPGSAM